MVRIKVPATSANMGSGFDSIGIALTLYNVVQMDHSDRLDISCISGHNVKTDERNLIYCCAKKVFDLYGRTLEGLKIVEQCNIPKTRGLGSSSACVVAGIMGANELLGGQMSRQDLIDMAAVIEGHPDNSTPAIRGGFVTALLENGRVWQVRVPISDKLRFCALVPDFKLETEKARAILPKSVAFGDALFNLSRAALLAGSLVSGEMGNIGVAVDDRLHQPYRLELIPGGREIMESARSLGALGAYISGAGPTIIAIVDSEDTAFFDRVSHALENTNWTPIMLSCDEAGAVLEHDK